MKWETYAYTNVKCPSEHFVTYVNMYIRAVFVLARDSLHDTSLPAAQCTL